MFTKRMSVAEFLTDFSDIDDINYTHKIIVFSEGYSDEEYDKIYDLLRNKWAVNKLRYLNKLVGHNGSGPVYDTYDDNHKLIKRQLILVENCDLEVIESAYELWEYLDMDYELYLVCPEIKEERICF